MPVYPYFPFYDAINVALADFMIIISLFDE